MLRIYLLVILTMHLNQYQLYSLDLTQSTNINLPCINKNPERRICVYLRCIVGVLALHLVFDVTLRMHSSHCISQSFPCPSHPMNRLTHSYTTVSEAVQSNTASVSIQSVYVRFINVSSLSEI